MKTEGMKKAFALPETLAASHPGIFEALNSLFCDDAVSAMAWGLPPEDLLVGGYITSVLGHTSLSIA